jgi:hypothetical protein
MKIKELNEGVYKVRKENYVPYGAKHPRSNNNTIQILRVTGVGQSRLYFLDHDTFGRHPDQMADVDRFEVLSRYDGDPQISNCKINIQFTDASGEAFEFTVRDAWSLKSVFESMPWLKRPFGYIKLKTGR